MRKIFVVGLVVSCSLPMCAQRVPEHDVVVQEDSHPLIVRYANGTIERYIAKWTGNVRVLEWEDGEPATWTHPWDNRRCHWQIGTHIDRKLYLTNALGEQFAKEDMVKVYNTNLNNDGSSLTIELRPENCNDTEARFQSDVKDATLHVQQQFQGKVASDLEALKTTIHGWDKVVDVSLHEPTEPQQPSSPPVVAPLPSHRGTIINWILLVALLGALVGIVILLSRGRRKTN